MVIDSEKLKSNGSTLLEKDSRAKSILQKADGKRNYKDIAKELNINEKIISPLLKQAEELGFAKKIKAGVYKKITSTMKYIPNSRKIKKTSDPLINKVLQKAGKVKNNSKFNKLLPKTLIGSKKFLSLIIKMKDSYELLYLTENFLREFIRQVLSSSPDWWNRRVPRGVKTNVRIEISKAKYNDPPKKDELEYTHLGDLGQIIIYSLNWNDFKPFLNVKDKSQFLAKINEAIRMRNAIGHCIPLRAGDDQRYAEMRFKDILKMFK